MTFKFVFLANVYEDVCIVDKLQATRHVSMFQVRENEDVHTVDKVPVSGVTLEFVFQVDVYKDVCIVDVVSGSCVTLEFVFKADVYEDEHIVDVVLANCDI